MPNLPPIPRSHINLLCNLAAEGGAGELDRYGRLVVGQARVLLPGDAVGWLYLVSRGLIGGEEGRIVLTEAGREAAAAYIQGRTREAV